MRAQVEHPRGRRRVDVVTGETKALPTRVQPRRPGRVAFQMLLTLVLVFQFSFLPDTLGMKSVSRVVNIAALLIFCVLAFRAFSDRRMMRGWFVAIPVALCFLGFAVNISQSLSTGGFAYAGALIPFAAALSVPFMRSYDLEAAWTLFYRFMLLFAVIACVEYAAVFLEQLAVTPVVSQNGDFLRGIFTVFNELLDGSVDRRMYGVFPEPGTFAMYLLPAIVYALAFGKHLPLFVFVACMWLTQSFGGEASLVLVVILFVYWKTGGRFVGLIVLAFVVAGADLLLSDYFVSTLATNKANSAAVRQEQVMQFGATGLEFLRAYPLGMPLSGGSVSNLQMNRLYIGSNFAPFAAMVMGGVVAFAGYISVLALSLAASIKYLRRPDSDPLRACAFVSLPGLLLFIFQRGTIFETALFAFLFVAPIIEILRGSGTAHRAAGRVRLVRDHGAGVDDGPRQLLRTR